MKKYRVYGEFEGRRVNEVVRASKSRHAKLRAGFNAGFGGNKLSPFMSSSKIKVIKV